MSTQNLKNKNGRLLALIACLLVTFCMGTIHAFSRSLAYCSQIQEAGLDGLLAMAFCLASQVDLVMDSLCTLSPP